MKLKQCSVCKRFVPLWKSKPPTCKACMSKQPINKVSETKKAENKVYSTLRLVFLKSKPLCEAKLSGCTITSTEVHHLYSGKNRSKYYLNPKEWKSICRNCHDRIHNSMSMEELIELGLKKTE